MSISISYLKNTFGGSNPVHISNYYQGGSIMGPGVYPNSVPTSGAIKLSNFVGVPEQHNWNHNQRTSGDQPNDGAGWTVDYISGPLGWGLYATVWYYTSGQQVSPLTAYACSQYIKFGTANTVVTSNPSGDINVTVPPYNGNGPAAGPTGGVLSAAPDGRYGDGIHWLGYITGYWDGASTVYITGSYGSGGPGDAGYAYATGQVRGNWSALSGGTNTVGVGI
jgi:hypothetical protein